MRAEQVAVPGDHSQLGTGADHVVRRGEVVGDHHPGQQPGQCRGEFPGRLHQIDRGHHARRKCSGRTAPRRRFSGSAARRGAGAGDDQPGRSRVGALETVQDRHGGVQAGHGHRIGGTAERGRDGLLRALGHGQQGSDPAEDMPGPLRVRQQGRRGGRAVLDGPQALFQRLAAGDQGGALGAGHPLGSAALGDAGGAFGERGGRLLVRGGQAGPVVGPAARQFLCLFVLPLGELGTGPGLLDGVRKPGRLLLAGRDAAAGGAHLAAQPGQLVGAGRGGAGLVGEQPFGRGQVRLCDGAALGGLAERGAGRLQGLAEDRLLLAQRGRLGVQFAGIPARPGRGLVSGQQGMTLAGEVGHPAQSFGQRRELEPGVERRLEPGRMLLLVGVKRRLLAACLSQQVLQFGPAGQGGRLVRLAALKCRRGTGEVVGQQPQPGVAQVRLDRRGPAGDRCLPAQRAETAAQFAGEVHQPGQVDLHGLQLAEGLLLAPPVLEYPRGLLDERTARLGPGVQHLVELALADDHVHFPAQARVGEQFGDIEEPALVPVDGVLALAGPEEQSADGHFCVVDRERAIGVVDGEGDLGPAERRPGGGAGEDDVVHLAAAQALGALLAHDPGERVHDV